MVFRFRFGLFLCSICLFQIVNAQDYSSILEQIWAESSASAYYNQRQSEKLISVNNNLVTIVGQLTDIASKIDSSGGGSSSGCGCPDYTETFTQMLDKLEIIRGFCEVVANLPDYLRYNIEPILNRIDSDLDSLSSILSQIQAISYMAELQNLNLIKIRNSLANLEGVLTKLDSIVTSLSTVAYDLAAVKDLTASIDIKLDKLNTIDSSLASIDSDTSNIVSSTDSIDDNLAKLLSLFEDKLGGSSSDDDLLTNYNYSQGVSDQVASVEELKGAMIKSIEEDAIYNTVNSTSSASGSSNPVLGNPDSEDSWSGSSVSNVTITNVDSVVNRYGEVEESSSSSTTDSKEFYVDLNKVGVNEEFDSKVLNLLDMADSKQKMESAFSSVTGNFEFWDLSSSSSEDTSGFIRGKADEMFNKLTSGIDVGSGEINSVSRPSGAPQWSYKDMTVLDFGEVDRNVSYFLEDNSYLNVVRNNVLPVLYSIIGGFACIKIFVWGLKA